jgi:hypothetical protein
MRTLPGPLPVTAEASDRAFGTLPPAAGFTDLSGRGSGQYDGRSRCASASAGNASARIPATTANAPMRVAGRMRGPFERTST